MTGSPSSGPPRHCPVPHGRASTPGHDSHPAQRHEDPLATDGPVPLYGTALLGDLFDLYRRMRARHGPVVPVAIAPGIEAWLVVGHRELLRLTRDERHFSHDPRRWTPLREGTLPADSPIMPMVGWRPALLYADGPQHRRTRAAVVDALHRINGHELCRTVRATAEELIAGFDGRQHADLMAEYARLLPLQVITRLLGLDEETGPRLIDAIVDTVAATEDSASGNRRMTDILTELIAAKRRRPTADLTSWLLTHSAGLSDEEVLHNLVVAIVAGNQTTVNWIATTLHVLLTDPAFRSSLRRGHLTVDDALDLVLWRHPPTSNFPARYATGDVRLGGQDVRTGDMLILGLEGANGDPEVLPADGRPITGNRSHLAFGAGPHTCPAQDPARLITRTAVDTVRHRLPDLELDTTAPELSWTASPWSRVLDALPVRFGTPQLAAGPAEVRPVGSGAAPTPPRPSRPHPAPAGPSLEGSR